MANDRVVKYSVYSVNVGLGIAAFVFSLAVTTVALTYFISSDRFLSKIIHEFNKTFPDKENKPDVCNGLNVIDEISDSGSDGGKVRDAITRWLRKSKKKCVQDLPRGESV